MMRSYAIAAAMRAETIKRGAEICTDLPCSACRILEKFGSERSCGKPRDTSGAYFCRCIAMKTTSGPNDMVGYGTAIVK